MFNNKAILITGGTGSFGNNMTKYLLENYDVRKIVIYSRDEFKQWQMAERFKADKEKLRFFVGDVRDGDRLFRAFHEIDYVIHAAAMKQVPACEYNPSEAIKTNINGAQNVIDAAIDCEVKKVVALSTDKAVNPINLYGGTKLVSDKLFIAANAYSRGRETCFSVVRYGNVAGSRGSVIPFFRSQLEAGKTVLPITDYRMTRFWISLNQGVELVVKAFRESVGGETYISKIPSFRIVDLAKAIGGDNIEVEEVGIRDGEKIHEVMITEYDSPHTYEYDQHYIIYTNDYWWNRERIRNITGKKVGAGFEYNSGQNTVWLTIEQLRVLLKEV
ncbi:UDP-N-acetylglucosamine 4,6-dehydratase (inverting) [Anaerosinus massiliensis]|uniref:UDP-N-acetylglucosamine 4,6-dehydratase (inverting) n=1 Tax=Massilibacillus massiliensis TaxID=1806837 RepID=UPI000AB26581|nr:UDP-N-acetylglucosamine 4,6-dehydratase (inverting) [Massilibacillus massiliensis]